MRSFFSESRVAGLRQRQTLKRDARILRAARALFARKKGYAGTRMQEIARRSRLAVGTLYNYYPSKSKILLAIVARATEEGIRAGEVVLKRPPRDPVRAVERLIEQALAPYGAHERGLWRELVAAAMTDPEFARQLFASDLRQIGLLTALMRELEARGDLRPGVEPGPAAIALYSAFFTGFFAYLADDGVELTDVRMRLRQTVGLILRGLLAAPRIDPTGGSS